MEKLAERIIEDAHDNVRNTLASADAEVAQFVRAAKDLGQRRAEEDKQELLRKIQIMSGAMHEHLKLEVLRCAVLVAREVLEEETKSNQEVVMQAALRAFLTVPDARGVSLRANHEDVDFLKANKERLLEGLERAKEIEIRADKSVKRGGVILQTKSGVIDAQISTQLEEIAATLGV